MTLKRPAGSRMCCGRRGTSWASEHRRKLAGHWWMTLRALCCFLSPCVVMFLTAVGVRFFVFAISPAQCAVPIGYDGLAPLLQARSKNAAALPALDASPLSVPSVFLFDSNGMWESGWLASLGFTPDLALSSLNTPESWPSAVVVVCSTSIDTEPYASAFRAFQVAVAAGTRFGLVHLSDESGLAAPTRSNISALYGAAQWVFRNYWLPSAPAHIHYFPLGYKTAFPAGVSAALAQPNMTRNLAWGFAGSVKPNRGYFLFSPLKGAIPHQIHWTSAWNSTASITTVDYASMLTRSIFAPIARWVTST
jgi:hypothetical protein